MTKGGPFGRLALGTGGGSAPSFPATQTIAFGAKTLRGHGGHALGYAGAGALTITAGNGSGFWAIDSRNHLVIAGTYGTAPPALATGAAAYTLTIGDGTVSSVVTVNVTAYEYSIRAPITGTNADTASSFQLRTILNAGSLVNFGDTIRYRDGSVQNVDALLDQRIRKATQFTVRGGGPSAPTDETGDGWVKITAETAYGATIRRLQLEGNTVAEHYVWFNGLVFERFNLTALNGSSTTALLVNSTAGSKFVKITGCRIRSRLEGGVTIGTTTNIAGGLLFSLRQASAGTTTNTDLAATGNYYVLDNEFSELYDGVVMNGSNVKIIGNTFDRVWNDCVKGTYSVWDISWNTVVNKVYGDGALHGDFFQLIQNELAADTYVGGTFTGNILLRGVGRDTFADGQGIFLANDTTTGVVFTGIALRGNLYVGTFSNGITIESGLNAVAEWNTIIYDRGPHGAATAATAIGFASGNDGGTARFNAVTSTSTTFIGSITGAPQISPPSTVTPNIVGLDSDAEYTGAFASPAYGAANNSLTEALANWAMKSGGSLDMATTGFAAHCGAVGTGYVDYVNRTTSFPAV